jgi:glycosidase
MKHLPLLMVLWASWSLGLAQADLNLWRQQVIYLVMPDRFFNGDARNDNLGAAGCFDPKAPNKFHGGDWAGLKQKLGYLKELGVSALWITPAYKQIGVLENGACGYHGYWADFKLPDDGALEPKLGTKADLENLISSAQAGGIKFILDMVVNHPGYGARIVQQKPTWFHRSPGCLNQGSATIFCPLAGLPDFAQEQPQVATYLTGQSRGWAGRYRLDGIRMDTAKHVPLEYWQQSWIPGIRKARGKLFVVAEAFWDNSAEDLKPYFEVGFDSAFNFPLRKALVTTFAKGESVDKVASRVKEDLGILGLDRHLMLSNLLDNHDVPRFINEPGFGVPEDEIRRRYHLALAAMFTLPGIPQLYYGNELALYGGGDPDNRRDMPAWAWNASGRGGRYGGQALPNPQSTFAYVQKLIALRKQNPALYQGSYAELWRQNGGQNADVWAYFRGSGQNRVLVVINNGTLESGLIKIPIQINTDISEADRAALSDGSELQDLLGAGAPERVRIEEGSISIDLPGKSVGIYR